MKTAELQSYKQNVYTVVWWEYIKVGLELVGERKDNFTVELILKLRSYG